MRREIFILISVFILCGLPSIEQCTPKSILYKKIIDAGSGTIAGENILDTLDMIKDQMESCNYHNDSLETSLLRSFGWAYFDRHDYVAAISYFKKSVQIVNENINSPAIRPKELINTYYYLSTFCDSLNNGAEKRKFIDSCITIAFRLKLQNNLLFLNALFSRLAYFYNIGEYRLCSDDAVLCEKYAGEYLKTATNATDRTAGLYFQQSSFGWNVNALVNMTEFNEAEKILSGKINEYSKAGLSDYLAFTYSKLAQVEEKKESYKKVLFFSLKSFELYRKGGYNLNCKQLLNRVADKVYFRHLNKYDSALFFFRKALSFKNNDKDLAKEDMMEELSIYGNIGNVYIAKGQYDSAFLNFDHAFNEIKSGLNEKNILQYQKLDEFSRLHKIDYLVTLLIDKGDAYKRRFDTTKKTEYLKAAIVAYSVADKLLERVIKAQFDMESRLYWRKNSRRLYENAISACYLANDPEKAFYFFEKSRALLLTIQLAEQTWMIKDDISMLSALKKKLIYFQGLRKSVVFNSAAYKQYSDSILMGNQELYYKEEGIKQQNKGYYLNNDTFNTAISDVRKVLLKDHHALFEIFSGTADVYLLLIKRDTVQLARIDKRKYQEAANGYISYLSNRNLQNSDFMGFTAAAGQLYKLLFQKFIIPEGRIIVSPEGEYFPFESLITGNDAANPDYFLAKHIISYTYSARYLINNSISAATGASGNFFGIAPIQYLSNPGLPDLTGSDLSLENIGSYMANPEYLIRYHASRGNFLSQFPKYKIIQLYTHASDSSSRREPVIYFYDSALYLSELVPGIKPVTQLIVLSACETGNGTLYQGEGVFNFNRAFAALGVPSSVTNLWSIDNLSTYRITELFYKYLSRGLPLDNALQKAKLEFLKNARGENRLPYYWAAPVLVGKTDPIALDKPFTWKYLIAGIGLAGIVFFCWKKWRNTGWLSQLRV